MERGEGFVKRWWGNFLGVDGGEKEGGEQEGGEAL